MKSQVFIDDRKVYDSGILYIDAATKSVTIKYEDVQFIFHIAANREDGQIIRDGLKGHYMEEVLIPLSIQSNYMDLTGKHSIRAKLEPALPNLDAMYVLTYTISETKSVTA